MYLLVIFISIVSSFKESRYLMKSEYNHNTDVVFNPFGDIESIRIILNNN